MGLGLDYDSFVSLSFGFFVAFISVRLTHEMGNGWEQLRRRWRQAKGDEQGSARGSKGTTG